jgi:hypothetical protein
MYYLFFMKRQFFYKGWYWFNPKVYSFLKLVTDFSFNVYNCMKCSLFCIKCKKINFFWKQ